MFFREEKWVKVIIAVGIIMWGGVFSLDLAVAANIMLPDNYSFTIMMDPTDIEAPMVQGCFPEANAIDISRSTNIQASIVDRNSAVDINSIDLSINNISIISNGITQRYQDIEGNMVDYAMEIIEKSSNEYVLMYDPAEYLNYEEQITVSISAQDIEGNALNGYSYTFKTQNFMTGSFTSFGNAGGTFEFSETGVEVQNASEQVIQGNSFIESSSSGKYVFICWEQCSSTGVWDIYCARSTDYGNNFEMPVKVNPAAAGAHQRFPSIAVDSSDNVYIAWQQKTQAGNWNIYIAKMDSSANAFSSSYPIYAYLGGLDQIHPAITIGPALKHDNNSTTLESATVYVVWTQGNETVSQLCYNRTTSDYSDAWYEFVPMLSRVDNDRWPQIPADPIIKIDDSGRTFVAWRGKNSDGTSSIYYDRARASVVDGSERFGEDVVISNRTAGNMGPEMEVSSDGNNIYIVWKELDQGLSQLKFSYYRYNYWRYQLIAERYINDNAMPDSALGDYSLSMDKGRDVTVVWSEVRLDNRKIFMAGASYDTYQFSQYTALSTPGEQNNPSLAMDENGGHYYVSWTDNSSGSDSIYFCRNTFIVTDEVTSQKIENYIGGTLVVNTGAIAGTSITVPPNAIDAPITITVTQVVGAPDTRDGLRRVGNVIDFGPGQTCFNVPAEI